MYYWQLNREQKRKNSSTLLNDNLNYGSEAFISKKQEQLTWEMYGTG